MRMRKKKCTPKRLEMYKDFFIHPSAGLQDQYLGEHFFEVIRHAAAEAKRLGLHYWIYDEFDWPSGTAGGRIAENPMTHSSCFCRLKEKVGAGETVEISLPYLAYQVLVNASKIANTIRPTASSRATTGRRMAVRGPFALY